MTATLTSPKATSRLSLEYTPEVVSESILTDGSGNTLTNDGNTLTD